MAGVQRQRARRSPSANAGGLGSLPCAMLDADAACASELAAIRAGTQRVRSISTSSATRRRGTTRRARRAGATGSRRYYAEFGIDPDGTPAGAGRASVRRSGCCELVEDVPARGGELPLRPARAATARRACSATGRDDPVLGHDGRRGALARGARLRRRSSRRGSRPAATAACSCPTTSRTQVGTFALVPQVVDAVRIRAPIAAPAASVPMRPAWRRCHRARAAIDAPDLGTAYAVLPGRRPRSPCIAD